MDILRTQYAHAFGSGVYHRIVHDGTHQHVCFFLNQVKHLFNGRNLMVLDIPAHSSHLEHGIGVAVPGNHFKEVQYGFTIFPGPHKYRVVSQEMTCKTYPEQMAVQALQLCDNGTDKFGPIRDFHTCNLLHRIGKCKWM